MTAEEFPDTVSGDHPTFDPTVAHQARVYDYLIGGKNNYAADRAYAEATLEIYPAGADTARANRAFLGRAVHFLATDAGVSQFLDIGTGIPAAGSTHEVAQEVSPDARIVYVDNDPVVLSHARALLIGCEPGTTDYIDADLRDPESILRQAAQTLDFTRPVGVLLLFILHVISDADDPHRIVATIMNAVPPDSYLAVSHMSADLIEPGKQSSIEPLTREMSYEQYCLRGRPEIARFFDGLDLVEPGLVPTEGWRPEPGAKARASTCGYAGIARKK